MRRKNALAGSRKWLKGSSSIDVWLSVDFNADLSPPFLASFLALSSSFPQLVVTVNINGSGSHSKSQHMCSKLTSEAQGPNSADQTADIGLETSTVGHRQGAQSPFVRVYRRWSWRFKSNARKNVAKISERMPEKTPYFVAPNNVCFTWLKECQINFQNGCQRECIRKNVRIDAG